MISGNPNKFICSCTDEKTHESDKGDQEPNTDKSEGLTSRVKDTTTSAKMTWSPPSVQLVKSDQSKMLRGLSLSVGETNELLQGEWLNDNHMMIAMRLIKSHKPHLNGLTNTQLIHQYTGSRQSFIQIIHQFNHWIYMSDLLSTAEHSVIV
jgi:hypothetical protein